MFPGEGDEGNEAGGAGLMAADSSINDKRFYSLAELAEMEPIFE